MPSFGPAHLPLVPTSRTRLADAAPARRGLPVLCETLENRVFLSAAPAANRFAALPRGVPGDQVPPTAAITRAPVATSSGYEFEVTYRDNNGVMSILNDSGLDLDTLDSPTTPGGAPDIRIVDVGMMTTDVFATAISSPRINADQSVTVRYLAPSGLLDNELLIFLEDAAVADGDGNVIEVGTFGNFTEMRLPALGSFAVGGQGGGGPIERPPGARADLVSTIVEAPASAAVAGTRGSVRVRVENRGDERIRGKTRLALYASTDSAADGGDTLITAVDQRPFGIGQVRNQTLRFVWPQVSGSFFIVAKADDNGFGTTDREDGFVDEQFEQNNDDATPAPITISSPFVDVAAQIVGGADQSLPTTGLTGSRLDVDVLVSNRGNVQFPRNSGVTLFLSSDQTLDATDIAVSATGGGTGRLAANSSKELQMRFDVPSTLPGGPFYVIAFADSGGINRGAGVLVEPNDPAAPDTTPDPNNVAVSPFAVNFARPFVDLVGTTVNLSTEGPGALQPGRNRIALTFRNAGNVRLQGPLDATIYVTRARVVAPIGPPDSALLARLDRNVNIAPGASQTYIFDFNLPPGLTNGSYFLRGNLDTTGRITESDETNNDVFSGSPFVIL